MKKATLPPEVEEKLMRTRRLILDATAHYGEPTMTLEQLQSMLSAGMGDDQLSDMVIQQRREQI